MGLLRELVLLEGVTLFALMSVAAARLEGPIETLYVLDENRDTGNPGVLAVDLPSTTSRGYFEDVLPRDTRDIAYEENTQTFLATTGNTVFRTNELIPNSLEGVLRGGNIPEEGGVCGYESTLSEGVFGSPNYPSRPPSNVNCEWTFIAPEGQVIELVTLRINLQFDCSRESIMVYDNDTLLQEPTCGSFMYWPREPITSTTRFMRVLFKSASIFGGFGFVANFRHVAPRAEAFFLISDYDNDEIFKLNKYSRLYETFPVPGLSKPYGIDIDSVDRMVYYVSQGEGIIGRIGLDDSNQEVLFNGSMTLTRLKVDHINRDVYWLDDVHGLSVMAFDGSNQSHIVNITATDFAIDPDAGYIFWSNISPNFNIERLDIATKTGRRVILSFITYMRSIAVDEAERKLYLGFGGVFTRMGICNYDGSGFRGISSATFRSTSILVFDNYLFFSTQQTRNTHYQLKENAQTVYSFDSFYRDFSQITGLAYYSRDGSRSFQKETEPFLGSEGFSFHNKYFKGIAVDNRRNRTFLMYFHYNVDTWAVVELIGDDLQHVVALNSSDLVTNPRLMVAPINGWLFFGGKNGVYRADYDVWDFEDFIHVYGSILHTAINVEETMLCYIEDSSLAQISCHRFDQADVTFMQNGVEFTGITFYGSYLFASSISEETNETLIHHWSYESQEYQGVLTPNGAGSFGSGLPLRYLLVDASCNDPFEASVAVYPCTVKRRSSVNIEMTSRVRQGNFGTLKKSLTESPNLLPRIKRSTREVMKSVTSFRGARSDRELLNGIFSHEFSNNGGGIRTVTIQLQGGGKLSFDSPARTVYPGDDVPLSVPKPNLRNIRWRFNGRFVPQWKRRSGIVLRNVGVEDAGVYEVHLRKQRRRENKGFVRVIVQECPRGFINPPYCNESSALNCYNGGVLRQDTDTCVCAPGFIGCDCESFALKGHYGVGGHHPCPEESCEGVLICLLDPYGCSCAAGYEGPACTKACSPGSYGANCQGTCHCNDNALCDKITGECTEAGGCEPGWEGPNCQIEELF